MNCFGKFENFLQDYFETEWKSRADQVSSVGAGLDVLRRATLYSLMGGGKRFRPRLAFLSAEAMELDPERIFVWAAAIEFIHTYSLIHDDLPAMDNDDFRRGLPSNHRVHGEDMALLAGDALLTEAFLLLTRKNYPDALSMKLIEVLGRAAGYMGMVGGQALDLRPSEQTSVEEISTLHRMKTGALISATIGGVAQVARVFTPVNFHHKYTEAWQKRVSDFGLELGFAFQLKDDLLDLHQKKEANKNLALVVGEAQALSMLNEKSQNLKKHCEELFERPSSLLELIEFNKTRDK